MTHRIPLGVNQPAQQRPCLRIVARRVGGRLTAGIESQNEATIITLGRYELSQTRLSHPLGVRVVR